MEDFGVHQSTKFATHVGSVLLLSLLDASMSFFIIVETSTISSLIFIGSEMDFAVSGSSGTSSFATRVNSVSVTVSSEVYRRLSSAELLDILILDKKSSGMLRCDLLSISLGVLFSNRPNASIFLELR